MYEKFMKTAKIIWEEFTGTSTVSKPVPLKEEKSSGIVVNVQKKVSAPIPAGKFGLMLCIRFRRDNSSCSADRHNKKKKTSQCSSESFEFSTL